METGRKSIIQFMKNSIFFLALLVILITILLIYSIINEHKFRTESQKLLQLMSIQYANTQIMAKSAFEIETLLKDPLTIQDQEKLSDLQSAKKELENAYISFNSNLLTIDNGVFYVGKDKLHININTPLINQQIEELEVLWQDFRKNVETILYWDNSGSNNSKELAYIAEHNKELANYTNLLFATISNYFNEHNQKMLYIYIVLIIASLIFLIYLIYRVYQQIFKPLYELYKGMDQIGVNRYNLTNQIKLKNDKFFAPIFKEINDMFARITTVFDIVNNINQSTSFHDTIKYIYETFAKFIPYNYISIALLEDSFQLTTYYVVADQNLDELKKKLIGLTANIKETSLAKLLETGEIRVINDYDEYFKNRETTLYSQMLIENGVKSSITVPLRINQEKIGFIFFNSKMKNIYNDKHVFFLNTIANSISISFHKNILINDVIYSSVLAMTRLAESKDKETGEHLIRIKDYSGLISSWLMKTEKYQFYVTPDYIAEIKKFSPLHDIGKVAIPDHILQKPGKLTKEEFEKMKEHTTAGAVILKEAESFLAKNGQRYFRMAIDIAESHHEKWDGTGYPNGLKEEEIPLSARIVAIADVFDALTTKRPYKEPFTFDETFAYLIDGKGQHFDPYIIDLLVAHKSELYDMYKKFMNGEITASDN